MMKEMNYKELEKVSGGTNWLGVGTVFWNIVESVAFVIFMNIFMNSYYKKKSKKQ